MAQIDLDDDNWECFIDEDFSGLRSWNSDWKDLNNTISNYSSIWRCYANEYWNCGATTASKEHQAFRPENAIFSSFHTMKLVGQFHTQDTMWCDIDYEPAPLPHHCDSVHKQHKSIHYYSGMIETINPVGFGYYEIECKMPVHPGACSSFWFWSDLGGTYNEIDVFEHSKSLSHDDINRETVSGIWYNPNGTNYTANENNDGAVRYDSYHHILPEASLTLENYHKFGCLWLPEKVKFYVDGNIVNECNNPEHIPQFPMWLKIMHLEDDDAKTNGLWWEGTDEMTINYVKAYRLKTDCNTDVIIRSITDFNSYSFSVKHSIIMGSQIGVLTLPSDGNYTIRAVESITIDGGFEVPVGTELTLITQECPQWLLEDLSLPSYNCILVELEKESRKNSKP